MPAAAGVSDASVGSLGGVGFTPPPTATSKTVSLMFWLKIPHLFRRRTTTRLVEPADPLIAANVARLNELLFGPLDYAIVART